MESQDADFGIARNVIGQLPLDHKRTDSSPAKRRTSVIQPEEDAGCFFFSLEGVHQESNPLLPGKRTIDSVPKWSSSLGVDIHSKSSARDSCIVDGFLM